jgi:hypothetical protein
MQSRCSNSGFFFAGLLNLILDLLVHWVAFSRFPPFIFRSGVLRQGFDKFYSVSFQARHSLFATLKSF